MNRRRDLTPVLSAFWSKRFPMRPEKTSFSDETLVLADMLMTQIDPDGTKPLVYPTAVAEGAASDSRVKPSGRGGCHAD